MNIFQKLGMPRSFLIHKQKDETLPILLSGDDTPVKKEPGGVLRVPIVFPLCEKNSKPGDEKNTNSTVCDIVTAAANPSSKDPLISAKEGNFIGSRDTSLQSEKMSPVQAVALLNRDLHPLGQRQQEHDFDAPKFIQSASGSPTEPSKVYGSSAWNTQMFPTVHHQFPFYPFRVPCMTFPQLSDHYPLRPAFPERSGVYRLHRNLLPHMYHPGIAAFYMHPQTEKLYTLESRNFENELNILKSAFSSVNGNSDYIKEESTARKDLSGADQRKQKESDIGKYQCDGCNKHYSTFSGLSKHKQFHCSNQIKKEFNCKYCEKTYVSLGALKMHIRTHTLPCKCKVCGKAFSRPWLLQGHIRTHTGEKPFRCSHCARAFADRSNLRAHLQTHSDVKKYSCKGCSKTFSRMSLLLKHEDGCCGALYT
ncbi:hypothetical protein CHS0354_033936 [Potamilus streckersoni]|uniref:C2H2-type domain-containing protein n=1 Tax=Potamilus streckersoni TaxID=2493646 RepID=A0AAE0RXH8_9BIVA|nr:hypothetical protein CHS0354_033936 [Potamilus streckersoni]